MSLDGNVVRHLVKEFNEVLISGRINKIYQISKYDLLFMVKAKSGKHQLLISSSPSYARIYLSEMKYEKPDNPPTFCMFLRKQLEGGIIERIEQEENDRIITFYVLKRNELGDLTHKKLIMEVMGRHSNIIVTDQNDKILESIKHNMPFDGTDRTIFPGATYEYPKTKQFNPYDQEMRDVFLSNPENINSKRFLQNMMGFSPLLSNEIIYRFENSKNPIKEIFNETLNEFNPVVINGKKELFYFTDMKHMEGDRIFFNNVNNLLDRFYYERDSINVIKQKSKNLIKFINNYIIRLSNKIEKLNKDLKNTEKRDKFKIKGELIQANIYNIKKGDSKLECINYYTNKQEEIFLDNKLSPIENSEKFFKKYKKLKTSIPFINKQIADAKYELEYFHQLNQQIESASLADIEEIKDELSTLKYIKVNEKKKKRKKKPNFDTYYDDLGIEILVGKNNIQNEYITHKLAKHNDVWFHTKEAPGSHVVVRHPLPLEEVTIRTASALAAYFSKMKNSSSVPVDYVEVRHIKKVPGRISSFVTYRNNKTIYIDPDEETIMKLLKK